MAKSRRNAPRGKAKPTADQPETGSVEDEVQEVTMETSEGSVDLPENEDLATDAPQSDELSETPSEPEANDLEADESQTEDETPEKVDSADASPVVIEDEGQELSGGDDTVSLVETSDQEPAVAEPQVIRETVVEKKAGFMPTALGGVVAAVIGFGAASYTSGGFPFGAADAVDPFQEQTQAALAAQGDDLALLNERVAQTSKALEILDLSPLSNAVAGLEDQLAAQQSDLTELATSVAAFDSRLTAIEKQPLAGALGPEAIAAYERELEELRLSIAAQQSAMDTQRAEIEAMAATARAAEVSAEEQTALSASRTALAELTALAQDGKAFAAPLAVLQSKGVAVPEPLSSVAGDGVATLPALVSDFPALAREALGIARREAKSETSGGGLTSFFQNQLGARSVTPREGDDPDAVLSRAEAAAKTGDLATVLDEIQSLPDASQAVLSDWAGRVAQRRDALAAAAALAQELNKQ